MDLRSIFARQLVGLDIGVSGIKSVELSGGKAPRLMAYNRVPLPWGAISSEGEIKQREVVVDALRRLFADKAFSSKRVAVGAAGNAVITKKITVEKMNEAELAHQLYWEAEQYLPFNVNEVNLDFAILGPASNTQATGPLMDVLLVAAKKDYISGLNALIEEAGLRPELVDIQAFALGNSFEFNYGHLIDENRMGAMSVILDFGAGSTKISVVEGDKTTFTREIRHGGNGCTTVLAERIGASFTQAEKAKIVEADKEPYRSIVREYVHTMVEEIVRTLELAVGQTSEKSIQGVYICGGASRMEGLKEELESRLSVPVQALNPIQNVSGSGRKMNAQAIRELAYLGAVAIGLALRSTGDHGK